MQVNLLPESTRLLILFDRQLRIHLRLWILVAVIATIYFTYQLFMVIEVRQQLSELDVKCVPVKETLAAIDDHRQRLHGLNAKKTSLASLQSPATTIAALGSVVRAMAAQPGKVHLQRLSIQVEQSSSTRSPVGTPAPDPKTPHSTHSLVIMGQAEDDAALSKLIADMRATGWMHRVELKSTSRSTNSTTRQFHIEAWHADLPPHPPQATHVQ